MRMYQIEHKEPLPVLNNLIAQIKAHIADPRKGLPEEIFEFVSSITPMVNVDLVVLDNQNRVLLSWRDDEHCGAGWHVPGGIVRFKETREERIVKTALREFGCEVSFDPSPIAINEVIMPQEVRGHFVSFIYRCYLPADYVIPEHLRWDKNQSNENAAGRLKWHSKNPEQWVRGQKQIYKSLFETDRTSNKLPII